MIKGDKPRITIVAGDYGYALNFTLKDSEGTVVNITGGTLVFNAQKKDKDTVTVTGSMTIISGAAGTCKYVVVEEDFDLPGEYYAEIQMTLAGVVQTFQDIIIDVQPQLPR